MIFLPSRCLFGCAILACCLNVVLSSAARFRMEKVNYIYDKALQRVLDKQRLVKLEDELGGFDRLLLENKENHHSGKIDKDHVATVDRKLRQLLEKYDLSQVLDAFEKKQEKRGKSAVNGEDIDFDTVLFGDEKLQKLWSHALKQKFAKDELQELYQELIEVQKKQKDLDDALHHLSKHPNENHVEHGTEDSHIHLEAKNKKAKEANRAVNAHYDELHKKVLNEEFSPFQNSKVKKMWQEAQRGANFTATDLDVIREELITFDKQLVKLAAHKEELDKISEPQKDGKNTFEHLENTEIAAKHEKLDRKLKKMEKYLTTKIKHSEL